MNRAQQRGAALRQDLGLSGCIDAEAVAVSLGLEVHPWPLEVLSELQVDGVVAVAKRLDPEWRRWVIAHAIGHRLLHPGNHLWLRKHTDIPVRYEREAEDLLAPCSSTTERHGRRGLSNRGKWRSTSGRQMRWCASEGRWRRVISRRGR